MANAGNNPSGPPQDKPLSSTRLGPSSEDYSEEDDPKPSTKQAKLLDLGSHQRVFYWEKYTSSGFPYRVNHASTAFDTPTGSQGVISIGGYHAKLKERLALRRQFVEHVFKSSPIDMHRLDYGTKEWSLVEPSPSSQSSSYSSVLNSSFTPRCRYGHTIRHFEGCLYMVGGRNDDDLSFHSLECYDIERNTWCQISCADGPTSLCGQAACIMGRSMYIHGGYDEKNHQFAELLWKFDFDSRTWTRVAQQGISVAARDFHSITAVNGSIYLFGGRSDLFAPMFSGHCLYDKNMYAFDTRTGNWTVVNTKGYQPAGRRSHVAEPYGDCIIFFGGYNAQTTNHYGDLFILNTTTNHITDVRPWGSFPSPRRRVASARVGSDFLIFGGTHCTVVKVQGKPVRELVDLSDMYILKLLNTLEQLCVMAVLKHDLPQDRLPHSIKERIAWLKKTAEDQSKMLVLDESIKRPNRFEDI